MRRRMLSPVTGLDDVWVPLVDEPIGSIVEQIESADPSIRGLVDSPRRLLVFRTFAYIRVGIALGQLLFESDVPPYDGTETWVEALLRDPGHRDVLAREVRAVAEQVAADADAAEPDEPDEPGPDEATRERFRAFVRETRA